jgi:S1-C subfamily serine protease
MQFVCFGSGACIDPKGLVVTAKHVIEPFLSGNGNDGQIQPGVNVLFTRRREDRYEVFWMEPKNAWTHSTRDVAFLEIAEVGGGWPSFTITTQVVNEGDPVATAGYPLRRGRDGNFIPNLFSGVISQLQIKFVPAGKVLHSILLDLSVHPGNSGGPVFNALSGELIGIVTAHTLSDVREVVATLTHEAPSDAGTSDTTTEGESTASALVADRRFKVWTNITNCEPWPHIKLGLDTFHEHLTQRGG